MYIITQNNQTGIVKIKSVSQGVYAKVCLNDGGSLQELTLNNLPLIVDLAPLTYSTTYASALLFPFANRIKDGQYRFNDQQFQLNTNNKEENNALHGLVYNKSFSVTHQSAHKEGAELIMEYDYKQLEDGFPFPFKMRLKYTFTKTGLDLNVSVINTSDATFPFTIGWHPYFLSQNLDHSILKFESGHKLNIGDRNIGLDLESISPIDSVVLRNKTLDDCWQLKGTDVRFETPNYKLNLSSSQADNFLQVYTPPKEHIIAIEPTTGVSDSFNNKLGLKFLEPKEIFDITWTLKIHTN
ncbi:aldose 1-epimerase [Gelidibacter salicanalis]|uniref:Aldose 1-epimerase n=1 Tax=Gelidibacter salicanalis TaxID=291193 RepID=A0A934KK01_9FLAO|nr:aldose 1-epimerase [Gelidibacter salicanalis]MBJ7880866.1 aldose 1-epimerase [Gelidibacter salicanalis]